MLVNLSRIKSVVNEPYPATESVRNFTDADTHSTYYSFLRVLKLLGESGSLYFQCSLPLGGVNFVILLALKAQAVEEHLSVTTACILRIPNPHAYARAIGMR